jgi:hypothetical protein
LSANTLKHTEDASLRFSEAICDFGSLIIEHGAEAVMRGFRDGYPAQAEQLQEAMNRPIAKQAALFRKDNASPPV